MEYLTAVFLQLFYIKTVKNWLLGGRLGTRDQIQPFQGLSSNFLIF